MTDYMGSVITGFTAGLGTGIANWLIIKRLEHIERKVFGGKHNG